MPRQLTMFKSSRRRQDWLGFENAARKKRFLYPAGVDEVGRGCLAGPVLAAALIFPAEFYMADINDSKKLSEKERLQLFPVIMKNALSWGVGMVSPEVIDQINILQASLLAMKIALSRLQPKADFVLVDGRDPIPDCSVAQRTLIKGDARSISIAAASILAKVTRDRMMKLYGRKYPEYQFDRNKGYGTLTHRKALQSCGLCKIHRKTFVHFKKLPKIYPD